MEYGYIRVSAKDQNPARQYDALRGFGLHDNRIFIDKTSGKDFNRPAYKRMIRRLKRGDVIYVTSIDRLGRNYEEIVSEWRRITKDREAHIVVLDMPLLDTRQERCGITGVLLTDIVLQLLSYVAQIERESIHRRQEEGIAAAKARGVRFGRPRIERPASYPQIKTAYSEGLITRKEAAFRLNVSASTFDNWLRRDASA
ncbi:MAG: recombinase family protein [Eggerthellaceae bacterium]|nr:recombinase family protein [Eggerthellaceae bacterium]